MNNLTLVEKMKNDIFKSFNSMRGAISYNEYWVVLFLLSVYKDNVEQRYLNNQENQSNATIELNKSRIKKYDQIYKIVEPILKRLDLNNIDQLFVVFNSMDSSLMSDNFPKLFEKFLQEYNLFQGRMSNTFSQPIQLTQFICQLARIEDARRIYNPFSGNASYALHSHENQYFFGQELNPTTWAIGQLCLLANDKQTQVQIECEDVLTNFPTEQEPFDLIISSPPFVNIRNRNIKGHFINTYSTIEQYIVEKGVERLSHNGKMILVVPERFLFQQGGSEHIIQNLIGKDLVDTIVSFPGGMLSNTNIQISVLVISKIKKMPGMVKFVDANRFVTTSENNQKVLDFNTLISIIRKDEEDHDSSIRIVPIEQIKLNDYNLSVPRYFRKAIDGVKLGDLTEIIRGDRLNLPDTGKLIRSRDLKDNNLDYTLNSANIQVVELNKSDIHSITDSCLLLSLRWKSLKATFFEYTDEPVFKGNDILSLRVDESKIDRSYLINELNSDYVLEQLESIRMGASIPYIKRDDLLDIVIKLPSLEKQKAKVEGAIQAYVQSKQNELKLQKEILGIKEDKFNEFASIKHTFRQYLSALKSNVTGTRKFLSNKNGMPISLDDIYSINLNQTLSDHLIGMEDTISALSKLLETETNNLNSTKVECFNLIDLVNTSNKRFLQDIFVFELEVDKNSFRSNEKEMDPLIIINLEDFMKLFSNIVSNAINHGFKNSDGNIIRSNISYDSSIERCILEVSNNGIPMQKDFTFQRLITRGEKTTDSKGTGIGGSDIKDIAAKYKGTFELIKDADSPFPVTYKISFPISKTTIENEI